jgi:hypothetical protein
LVRPKRRRAAYGAGEKGVAAPIEPHPAQQPGRARRSARAVLNQDVSTCLRGARGATRPTGLRVGGAARGSRQRADHRPGLFFESTRQSRIWARWRTGTRGDEIWHKKPAFADGGCIHGLIVSLKIYVSHIMLAL